MSTTRLTYPNVISIWRGLAIGLIVILIITSLVLIVGAILTIVPSPVGDGYPADSIPVVHTNSFSVAVPVHTAPAASAQLLRSAMRGSRNFAAYRNGDASQSRATYSSGEHRMNHQPVRMAAELNSVKYRRLAMKKRRNKIKDSES